MPGPLRDSLTRYSANEYSNICDVRTRPTYKPAAASPTQPINKDTLEISKEKLTQEALNRLRHVSKFVIVQNSFMRVGKFLFVAVAIPPFLLLYEIPKWTLMVALPQILSVCSVFFQKASKVAKSKTKIVTEYISKISLLIKKKLNVLLAPLVRVMMEIQELVRRVGHKVTRFLSQIHQRILRRQDQVKKSISKVRDGFNKINEWVQNPIKAFNEMLGKLRELPNHAFQMCLNFFKSRESVKKLSQGIKLSQNLAENTVNWVSSKFINAKLKAEQVTLHLKKFYQGIIRPIVEAVKNAIIAKWNPFQNKVKKRFLEARQFIQKGTEFFEFLQKRPHLPHFEFAWMPAFIRGKLQTWMKNEIVQAVIKGIIQFILFVVVNILKGIDLILKTVHQVIAFIAKWIKPIAAIIKRSISWVLNKLTYSLALFGKLTKLVLYHLIVTLFMVGLVFIWGLRIAGETTGMLFKPKLKSTSN